MDNRGGSSGILVAPEKIKPRIFNTGDTEEHRVKLGGFPYMRCWAKLSTRKAPLLAKDARNGAASSKCYPVMVTECVISCLHGAGTN